MINFRSNVGEFNLMSTLLTYYADVSLISFGIIWKFYIRIITIIFKRNVGIVLISNVTKSKNLSQRSLMSNERLIFRKSSL